MRQFVLAIGTLVACTKGADTVPLDDSGIVDSAVVSYQSLDYSSDAIISGWCNISAPIFVYSKANPLKSHHEKTNTCSFRSRFAYRYHRGDACTTCERKVIQA